MQAGTAVKYRVCSVHGLYRRYRYGSLCRCRYRYDNHTGTGHFGNVGTTSIPVPDTSVSSVRHPYRYRTEHTQVNTHKQGKKRQNGRKKVRVRAMVKNRSSRCFLAKNGYLKTIAAELLAISDRPTPTICGMLRSFIRCVRTNITITPPQTTRTYTTRCRRRDA